jgi:hypothetical protein
MASVPYYYGSFNMNDGVNYFLLEKDSPTMPSVSETLFKIGRLEGMKKTGEAVNDKQVKVKVRILGISRADLEAKVDTLTQALYLRQQHLQLHTSDARYLIADCVQAAIPLAQGNVITTIAQLLFLAQEPYAYASAASTYDSGNVTYSSIGGSQYQATFSFAGGGSVYAYPTIVLTAKNATTWSQLQIQQTTDSEIITLTSNLPTATNDTITIVCDPRATNGGQAYKNGSTANQCAINGIFPVEEPTATGWTITITAGATAPQVDTVWMWTPRWLAA